MIGIRIGILQIGSVFRIYMLEGKTGLSSFLPNLKKEIARITKIFFIKINIC
jgi:hypothetical protein